MQTIVFVFLVALLSAVADCSVNPPGGSARSRKPGSYMVFRGECQLSSDQTKTLITELKNIKKSQMATEKQALKNKQVLEKKIDSLEKKLAEVSQSVKVYYETLSNIFGHVAKSFVPKSKGSESELAVCPLTTCYRRGRISLKAAQSSMKTLSTVLGVTSTEGCALLCNQNKTCQAYVYDRSDKVCELVESLDLLEEENQTGVSVTIWIKSGSKLGKCPSFFRMKHKSSRYQFYRSRVTWDQAAKKCKQIGAKLAELTSKSETEYIKRQYMARSIRYWIVGGLQKNRIGNEPGGGWIWYTSKIPIPTPGFAWKPGNPDNYANNEHLMNAQVKAGKLYFNDLSASYRAFGYLCECIEVQ